METIAKVIKALLFEGDDINRTAISHLKDYIIGIIAGIVIAVFALIMLPEDEEDMSDPVTTEIDE